MIHCAVLRVYVSLASAGNKFLSQSRSSTMYCKSTSHRSIATSSPSIFSSSQHENYPNSPRIRRRKESENTSGPSSSTTEDRHPIHKPQNIVQDRIVFQNAVNAFLDKVQKAVEPMKQYNSIFIITRDQSSSNDTGVRGQSLSIRLKPNVGSFILQADYDTCTLSLTTPMSGSFTYVLCYQTRQFIGIEDSHILEGMLVRDLIRTCHGLPAL